MRPEAEILAKAIAEQSKGAISADELLPSLETAFKVAELRGAKEEREAVLFLLEIGARAAASEDDTDSIEVLQHLDMVIRSGNHRPGLG